MSQQNVADALSGLGSRLRELIEAAAGAVASIEAHGRPVASGLVWKPGIVVTASDALQADDGLSIGLPGTQAVPAQLAGRDPTTDIAVLRLAHDGGAMPPRGAPGDAQVGELVLAVGRGREGPIAGLGMVSVAGPAWRSRRGGSIDALIRLDLRLDPRAEGGVVVDAAGRLVGMPVFGPRQRPLVIPAATIDRVAPKLLAEGRIARGYLGVGGYPIRLDEALTGVHALPDRRAVMVVSLAPDGPARRAGVLLGDVIVSLDGESVPGVRALSARLGPETIGKAAELKILRAGQMTTVRVTIAASPAP